MRYRLPFALAINRNQLPAARLITFPGVHTGRFWWARGQAPHYPGNAHSVRGRTCSENEGNELQIVIWITSGACLGG